MYDDDAVDTLGDAVLDLFELTVRVLVRVHLDDLDTLFVERLGHGGVAGDPELGLEGLIGKADAQVLVLRLRSSVGSERECGRAEPYG